MTSNFPWITSEFDPSIRYRQDDFSLQFSAVGEDGLFLSFQPEARSGEIWISGMVYPPEGLDYLVRAFEVAAADFDTTIAQKIVRMTSIASVSSERAEVVDAYAKKRKSLKAVVERLGRQYGDCYLDESRPGKFDLVMKVL